MRDFCSGCEFYAPERAPDHNPCNMDHCVRHNDPYKPMDISMSAVAETYSGWVSDHLKTDPGYMKLQIDLDNLASGGCFIKCNNRMYSLSKKKIGFLLRIFGKREKGWPDCKK